jgi:hypothetical protein
MRRFAATAARLCGFVLAGFLLPGFTPLALAAEPGTVEGYEWMGGSNEGAASFVYGSPETVEDQLFWLSCEPEKKSTEMTVYDDVAGTKVGQPIAIDMSAGAAKTSVQGKIATDGMSGFFFPEAKGFKVKPVIEVLKAKGPLTVKTGKLTTILPEKGRSEALAAFAKACTLD